MLADIIGRNYGATEMYLNHTIVYIILCFSHMVSNGSYYKSIIFLLVDISQAHYYLL